MKGKSSTVTDFTPSPVLLPTLQELRKRIIIVIVTMSLATLVSYAYSEQIARFFISPLSSAYPPLTSLVYTHLTEAFLTYIKVSVLIGVIVSFPVGCYELWLFVSPGLYKQEKSSALLVAFWATILFVAGVVFAYWIFLPRALAFFMSFSGPLLEPKLKLGDYLTFVARLSLAFGLSFEIPFLMVAAGKTGIVSKGYFSGRRLSFYGAIAVLAFMLVAGDILSATLLAIPLICLYEAGVFLIGIFGKSPLSKLRIK